MNKRGEVAEKVGKIFWIILAVGIVYLIIAGWSFLKTGDFGIPEGVTEGVGENIGEAVSETKSNEEIFNAQGARFLDFVYGQIPTTLINWTNPTSAAIIVIGVWLLLLLTFGDIISLFGTFSQGVSWIIAVVLAIIAANLKIVVFLSVAGLVLASGLGAFAVFLNIIGIFIVFIGFNFGTDEFRQWVVRRKIAEMKMRAAMGSEKAKAGLQTLAGIGEESAKLGKRKGIWET